MYVEIQDSTCIPFRELFNKEYLEIIKERDEYRFSNIYFIAQVQKNRFELDKAEIIDNKYLFIPIRIGANRLLETKESIFSLCEVFFSRFYSSREQFDRDFEYKSNHIFFTINKQESSSQQICLMLKNAETEGAIELVIFPETVLSYVKEEFDNYPEVIYVGKSFRMLERLHRHEKILEANSNVKDDKEILLYLISFHYLYIFDDCNENEAKIDYHIIEGNELKSKEHKDRITLIERFLIYFFQPKYNNLHKSKKLEEDSLVKKCLIRTGITKIGIGIGMKQNSHNFWSKNQKVSAENVFYDFLDADKEFYEEPFQ